MNYEPTKKPQLKSTKKILNINLAKMHKQKLHQIIQDHP